MILQNPYIRIIFSDNGQPVELQSLKTKETIPFRTFRVTADKGIRDIWDTDPDRAAALNLDTAAAFSLTKEGNTQILTIKNNTSYGVHITQTVTLQDDASVARFHLTIENGGDDAVVTADYPILDAEAAGKDRSLFYPYHEGEIHKSYERFTEKNTRTASYPAHFSMQMMALFDENDSVYYAVEDKECTYKEFKPEKEEFFCRQYPFIAPGSAKTLPAVTIGFTGGTWRGAADLYRDWLIHDRGVLRTPSNMARNVCGWNACGLTHYPRKTFISYADKTDNTIMTMPEIETKLREGSGIDMTIFLGWHTDGFDSRYPDYEFYEEFGGEESCKRALDEIHKNGGHGLLYTNFHISEIGGKWHAKYGEECAVRKRDGSVYEEDYDTGLVYVAMCPCAKAWQESIYDVCERVRRAGSDGLWVDQIMEMPAYLCFNREHGHSTPATAFFEGYKVMLQRVDEIMKKYGDAYFYCCEGICDAYAYLFDVGSPVWGKGYGYAPFNAPETTRYTLPLRQLGLILKHNDHNAYMYGRAFVMANPLLSRRDRLEESQRVVKLYRKYDDIYLDGKFLHNFDLDGVPENVFASLIQSKDGSRAGIQLFNNVPAEAGDAAFTLTVAASVGAIKTAVDGETGESFPVSNNQISVSVPAGDIKSIILTF